MLERSTAATPACNWQPVVCANADEVQNYFRFNSHMCWEVLLERSDAVLPTVMDREIGDIHLRRFFSGAVRAHRGSAEIRHDHDAYFCLSLITEGPEVLEYGTKRVTLESGDIATWHSSQSFTFKSSKPVRRLSIHVPEASMKRILAHPASHAGLYLKHNSGINALLASYLAGLCKDFSVNDERTATEIEEVTLNLIGAAIVAPGTVVSAPPRRALWERVTLFIDRNLEDPELKPPYIASALGISLRNLYLLFAEQGHTVAGWIRGRRLECCRAELAKSSGACTVTEVAFRWGFNDAAHFSCIFKARYGLSPRSFRQSIAS
jgi:AraC-like DNA-binding protein